MTLNYPFVTTVSGNTATSYVSVADADAYIATRKETEAGTWAALEDADVQKYLMQATADIDTLRFIGQKYNRLTHDESESDYQRLEFPRDTQASEYIPEYVVRATCVQALYIYANSAKYDEISKLQGQGVESISFPGAATMQVKKGDYSQICPEAKRLLSRWITRAIDF